MFLCICLSCHRLLKETGTFLSRDAIINIVMNYSVNPAVLHQAGTQIQDNNHTKNARTRTSYWKGQQWFFNIIYSLWGMWLIHTKGESNPASQLREKSPLKHKQIALFIHEIFSASINLPCSSILINHSGCQGN